MSSNKKQREVYVGNLTIGVVADVMLRELFNGALAHLVPDPIANPPVVNAQLDPSGRLQQPPPICQRLSPPPLLATGRQRAAPCISSNFQNSALKQVAGPLSIRALTGGQPQIAEGSVEPWSQVLPVRHAIWKSPKVPANPVCKQCGIQEHHACSACFCCLN